MISVICGIATMRASEEANKVQVENFVEFQKVFFSQTYQDKELVLIEQREVGATEGAFDKLVDPRAIHKIVYNNRFTGAWLLNIGAVISSGELLAFVDADVVFGDDYLEAIVEASMKSDHPYIHGYDTSYWFNEIGRKSYLIEGEHDLKRVAPDRYKHPAVVARVVTPDVGGNIGLSFVCERDFYFDVVGGHNESFIEGGGRDNDFAFRVVDEAGMFPILDFNIHHLWHGSKIMGGQNQVIWPFTLRHPKLVTEEIKRMGIGDPAGPRNHTIEEWEALATQAEES